MSTLSIPAGAASKSAEATSELHKSLLAIANSNEPYQNPIGEAEPLLAFNGYYALNDKGAFLTIDTNMMVKNGKMTPHVILIYSPEGTQSTLYDLTGKGICFDSVKWDSATNTLSAISEDDKGASFYLTFTREDNAEGIIASVSGKVEWGPKDAVTHTPINGQTYNNPIPIPMYAGTYYEKAPGSKPHHGAGKGEKIMVIGSDNSLQYNFLNIGGDGGFMEDVDTFVYNLNMYVFSFQNKQNTIFYSIIMGTSAAGGMVCNDLVTLKYQPKPGTQQKSLSIPRSLQTISTIEKAPAGTPHTNNQSAENLAKLAGLYRLSSGPNAFLSIEGEYKIQNDGSKVYTTTMGISEDGDNLRYYTFNNTMTFENSVLNIPNPDDASTPILNLTFTRSYQPKPSIDGNCFGSVVQVSGHHNGNHVTGETLLNVVPLMGFAGAPLIYHDKKTGETDTIILKSSTEVEYRGTTYSHNNSGTQMTIVPLMYIVGFIDDNGDEVILSLGTDGGKGNTCLTTVSTITVEPDGTKKKSFKNIRLYTAIPDGLSGSPQEQKALSFSGPAS